MALYKFDFMFMLCYVASGETAAGWPAGWPYRSRPVLQDAAIALPLQPSVCVNVGQSWLVMVDIVTFAHSLVIVRTETAIR